MTINIDPQELTDLVTREVLSCTMVPLSLAAELLTMTESEVLHEKTLKKHFFWETKETKIRLTDLKEYIKESEFEDNSDVDEETDHDA